MQYCSPMKSGISADSSSATILRARWAGALSCWNAKKGPDIERMAGKRCCRSSVFPIWTIYLNQRSIKSELGTPKRWKSNGHHYWKNVERLRRKRSVHNRKHVSSAAGGTTDLYKIWWQYSIYILACARLTTCNAVQVCSLHLPEPNV